MEELEEAVDFEVDVDAEPLQADISELQGPDEGWEGEGDGDGAEDNGGAQVAANSGKRVRKRKPRNRRKRDVRPQRNEAVAATRPNIVAIQVSEIPSDIEIASVRNKFAEFGRVYQVMRNGRSACVEFYEKESASAAVKSLDGKDLFGAKSVRVNFRPESTNDSATASASRDGFNSLREEPQAVARRAHDRAPNARVHEQRVGNRLRSRSRSLDRRQGRLRSRSRDVRQMDHRQGRRSRSRSRSRSPRRNPTRYYDNQRDRLRDDWDNRRNGQKSFDRARESGADRRNSFDGNGRRNEDYHRGRADYDGSSARPRSGSLQYGSGSLTAPVGRRFPSPVRNTARGPRR